MTPPNHCDPPLVIEVRARDAFRLMRYFNVTSFTVEPKFICERENSLQLAARTGSVGLVGQIWVDGTKPKWSIELR